ncbi:hypothetical protein ACFQ48_14125 [Hymenobacter caeli]|uniref:DUF3592 domain-containing protein n=1 Tax=Hymenobacter caeli TaxID=2735894 RepID=A0ABX2FVQ7_9BACT|nr:hypothetical protein [Hymenobacter caeli]NRT20507.1 hypothetical protein [Hymenobacter caeli]
MTQRFFIIIIIISAIVIVIYQQIQDHKIASTIITNGVYCKALVIDKEYSHGSDNITFSYKYNGKTYTNYGPDTKILPNKGDSILIKFLPEDPDGSFIIARRVYQRPYNQNE